MAEAPYKVEIRLFGTPCLTINGDPATFRTSRVPALLGYLAAFGNRSLSRASIAEALWPDRETTLAHHNLRQTVLRLRQSFGEAVDAALLASRQDVRLRSDSVWCDIIEFRKLLAAPSVEQLRAAIEMYRGPFLAGFDDEWILPVRAELSQALVRALVDCSGLVVAIDPNLALSMAERAVREEPFHEGARMRKIQALRAMGEASLALKEFELYEEFLNDELGLRPSHLVEAALTDEPEPAAPPRSEVPSVELDQILETLAESERPEDGLKVTIAMVPYWIGTGQYWAGLQRLDDAHDSCVNLSANRKLSNRARLAAADLAVHAGDTMRAIRESDAVIAFADEDEVRAAALAIRGRCAVRQRSTTEGRRLSLEALRIGRQMATAPSFTADAWFVVCTAHLFDGSPVRARGAAQRGRASATLTPRAFARCSVLLAFCESGMDRPQHARETLESALARIETDSNPATADIRMSAARLFEELGDQARAEAGYRQAIEEFRKYGVPWGLGVALTYLGDLLSLRGDPFAAIPLHQEAREIRSGTGDRIGEATSLRGLGRAHLMLGNHESAREALRDSVRHFSEVDEKPGVASSLIPLAQVEAEIGSRAVARRLAGRAVTLLKGMSPPLRSNIGPRSEQLIPEAEALFSRLSD